MTKKQKKVAPYSSNFSIIFLGIADHIKKGEANFPEAPIDIFQLSIVRKAIVYPVNLANNPWIFLINSSLLAELKIDKISIKIIDENGEQIGNIDIQSSYVEKRESLEDNQKHKRQDILLLRSIPWVLFPIQMDTMLAKPGRYRIIAQHKDKKELIGEAVYLFDKIPPFSMEQIRAIESNPFATKQVRIRLGCKNCDSAMLFYSALDRDLQAESDGYIWQYNIEDDVFECRCGSTKNELIYIKESLHGFLNQDRRIFGADINYVRRYAHKNILKIIDNFTEAINEATKEQELQDFLQDNTALFALFKAKKIFNKTNILGKFETDFAILDAQNQLLLIEIERPNIKLFKKNGHTTQDLNHAYDQVVDWLNVIKNHRSAVLDTLQIDEKDVMAIKGVVIAGRKLPEQKKFMQRHLSTHPYPLIDFYTYDDLAESLLQLSLDLG